MVTNRQIFSGDFFATINLILYIKSTLDIRFGKIDGGRFLVIFLISLLYVVLRLKHQCIY